MKPKKLMLLFSLLALATTWSAGQSCTDYSANDIPILLTPTNTNNHLTGGYHKFPLTLTGYCTYASVGLPNCSSLSYSFGSISGYDTGTLTIPNGWVHDVGQTISTGVSQAPSGGATLSQTTAVWAVNSCLVSCAVSVSVNASASGVGATVSFPSGAVYANSAAGQTSCPNYADPKYGGGSGYGGGGNCGNGGCGGQAGGGCGSPIIIDTDGEGFHMTDVADGVLFDIRGNGNPVDMGWTARGYHNAFLALDRNGNGKIDNGEELFGNYTPQPKSKDANGYAALAEFDKPENGGNGDGVINEKDAIYSKLVLWIDENHDGISQPNELHHLWELGVFSLSLKYVDTPHRDGFGNWFRYKGKVNPLGEPGSDPVDRTSYDVFFELQAPGPRPTSCQ